MAKAITQIIGYENLTGIINDPQGGVPNLLPPAFMRVTDSVLGNTATWDGTA